MLYTNPLAGILLINLYTTTCVKFFGAFPVYLWEVEQLPQK